jgi:hypothetical protein
MTTPVARAFVFHFSNIGMVDEAASFDNIEALEAFMRSRTKAFTTDVYVSDNRTGCKYGFCYRDGTIEWYYSDIFTNSPQSVSTRVSKPKITANDLLLQCPKSGCWSGGTTQQAPFTRNFILRFTGPYMSERVTCTSLEGLRKHLDERATKLKSDIEFYDADSDRAFGQCTRAGEFVTYFDNIFTDNPVRITTTVVDWKNCVASEQYVSSQYDIYQKAFAERYGVTLLPTVSPTTKEQHMQFEIRYYLNGDNIEHMDSEEIDSVLVYEEKRIEELKARKFQTKQVQAEIKKCEEELGALIKFLDDRFDAKQAKQ